MLSYEGVKASPVQECVKELRDEIVQRVWRIESALALMEWKVRAGEQSRSQKDLKLLPESHG